MTTLIECPKFNDPLILSFMVLIMQVIVKEKMMTKNMAITEYCPNSTSLGVSINPKISDIKNTILQ
jgi:hypothetical protein